MNDEPSQSNPSSPPTESPEAGAADLGTVTAASARGTTRAPLWLPSLGAGLVAALLAWAGGEAIYPAFPFEDEAVYPANYKKLGGYQKEAMDSKIQALARGAADRKRAAASFGWLGFILAASLGWIGDRAARSSRGRLIGAVAGGAVGAVTGAAVSWIAVPLFYRYQDPDSGLLVLFLTHAAIFGSVGAASGLALGLGMGDRSRLGHAILGGCLGALIGTMALEASNSLIFPLMRTFEPIASQGVARGLSYACVAVGTALSSGLIAEPRQDGATSRQPG